MPQLYVRSLLVYIIHSNSEWYLDMFAWIWWYTCQIMMRWTLWHHLSMPIRGCLDVRESRGCMCWIMLFPNSRRDHSCWQPSSIYWTYGCSIGEVGWDGLDMSFYIRPCVEMLSKVFSKLISMTPVCLSRLKLAIELSVSLHNGWTVEW